MQGEVIRPLEASEQPQALEIINQAAQRYRGVFPDDRWHEPYMSEADLAREVAAGVAFSGLERDGALMGVMGVQPVIDVELIRHAYVSPKAQGAGAGSALLRHLLARSDRPILLGTWAAASWAIGFYQRNGFELVEPNEADRLLRTYWTISDRQIETSVVLRLPR